MVEELAKVSQYLWRGMLSAVAVRKWLACDRRPRDGLRRPAGTVRLPEAVVMPRSSREPTGPMAGPVVQFSPVFVRPREHRSVIGCPRQFQTLLMPTARSSSIRREGRFSNSVARSLLLRPTSNFVTTIGERNGVIRRRVFCPRRLRCSTSHGRNVVLLP